MINLIKRFFNKNNPKLTADKAAKRARKAHEHRRKMLVDSTILSVDCYIMQRVDLGYNDVNLALSLFSDKLCFYDWEKIAKHYVGFGYDVELKGYDINISWEGKEK